MKATACRNCEAYSTWGVVCRDCVRAYLTGAATALGAWTLQYWVSRP